MSADTKTAAAPKVELRPFNKLGGANHGWLNTRHHFSFADYFDMNRMNHGGLRVFNDDLIKSGTGFPPHPHRSMEIVSYLVEPNYHPATETTEGGVGIAHKDNTGSDGVTDPGDVQVMSVGSDGVVHSEYHADSKDKRTANLFQIWITPSRKVKESTWGTRHFPRENRLGNFAVLASGFEEDLPEALPMNSDSRVAGAHIEAGQTATYKMDADRLAYLVIAKGTVDVNGVKASPHDGVAIRDTDEIVVKGIEGPAEVILVDTFPVKEDVCTIA